MIRLAPGVWDDTLMHLRDCGRGRVECVVLWTGPIDSPGVVDAALHPEHTATVWNYRLNETWLHRLHLQLYAEHRAIRGQVHTHQGEAFHSATDDRYPAVNVPGFLSVVLPRFALGRAAQSEIWFTELTSNGEWHRVLPSETVHGLPA